MSIDLNGFWQSWGVTSGNAQATNQYEFWKGMVMSNGQVLNNQYDFFTYHNTTRYEWFKNLQETYPEVYDEYTFYKNTNDDRIYDYSTFYQYGGEYLAGTTTTTTTVSPGPSVSLLGGWDGFSEAYPMTSEDGENWELLNFELQSQGGIYSTCMFRVNGDTDWGLNTYNPTGIAYPYGGQINVDTSQTFIYNIYFNSVTGAFNLISSLPGNPFLFSNGFESPNCYTSSAQTLYTETNYLYNDGILYTDINKTTTFTGIEGDWYTNILQNGFNEQKINISPQGVISNITACFFPYLFSNDNVTADCGATTGQTLYCQSTPPQNGVGMYTDSEGTTQFNGQDKSYTYFNNSGVAIATMSITEYGTIYDYVSC